MPAVVLLSHLLPAGDASNYPPGEVIDATSAPGNKTTHLSAILGNKGKVHAFELSPGRWMTLRKMVDKAGCENVDYGVEGGRNFLETRPEEWEGVRYLMLDREWYPFLPLCRAVHLLQFYIIQRVVQEVASSTVSIFSPRTVSPLTASIRTLVRR